MVSIGELHVANFHMFDAVFEDRVSLVSQFLENPKCFIYLDE